MLLSVAHAPAAPAAPATAPHLPFLDVAEDNPHGERAGGFATGMTTDRAELREALDSARAAGVPPHRYATLTRQYWFAVGAENAGIDPPSSWSSDCPASSPSAPAGSPSPCRP